MPPFCSVCTHPQRRAIDAALLERNAGHWGGGYEAIARQFGLVKASVQRHERTHLRAALGSLEARPWRSGGTNRCTMSVWDQLCHFHMLRRETFLKHYHCRSIVEPAFWNDLEQTSER